MTRPAPRRRSRAAPAAEQFAQGLQVRHEPADAAGDLPGFLIRDLPVRAGRVVGRDLFAERSDDRDHGRDAAVGALGPETERGPDGQRDEDGLRPALRHDADAATRSDGDCAGDDAGK